MRATLEAVILLREVPLRRVAQVRQRKVQLDCTQFKKLSKNVGLGDVLILCCWKLGGFLGRAVGLDLARICRDRGGEERSCYSTTVCTVFNNCLHSLREENNCA